MIIPRYSLRSPEHTRYRKEEIELMSSIYQSYCIDQAFVISEAHADAAGGSGGLFRLIQTKSLRYRRQSPTVWTPSHAIYAVATHPRLALQWIPRSLWNETILIAYAIRLQEVLSSENAHRMLRKYRIPARLLTERFLFVVSMLYPNAMAWLAPSRLNAEVCHRFIRNTTDVHLEETGKSLPHHLYSNSDSMIVLLMDFPTLAPFIPNQYMQTIYWDYITSVLTNAEFADRHVFPEDLPHRKELLHRVASNTTDVTTDDNSRRYEEWTATLLLHMPSSEHTQPLPPLPPAESWIDFHNVKDECAVCKTANTSPTTASMIWCGDETTAHAFCGECFQHIVRSHVTLDPPDFSRGEWTQRRGLVCCPFGKELIPFSPHTITNICSPDIVSLYLRSREQFIVQQTEQHTRSQTLNEVRRLILEHPRNKYIRYIQDYILTTRCPVAGCSTPYHGFDGCSSLQCEACKIHFCAFCGWFHTLTEQVHAHVHYCELNPLPGSNAFGGPEVEEVLRLIMQNKVEHQLSSISNATLRQEVIDSIRPNYLELGLDSKILSPQTTAITNISQDIVTAFKNEMIIEDDLF